MTTIQWLTIVMIWLAFLCYSIVVAQMLAKQWTGRIGWVWVGGVLFFWLHVVLAFLAYYEGSLAVAYEATRRQTAETIGWNSGAGLYVNFLFGVVWTWDATVLGWCGFAAYRARSRAAQLSVHGFLALMFFNGTVVFGDGPVRWLGLGVTAILTGMVLTRFCRKEP